MKTPVFFALNYRMIYCFPTEQDTKLILAIKASDVTVERNRDKMTCEILAAKGDTVSCNL